MLVTREAFIAWLQQLPPGTYVGRAGVATECPIARFIQADLPDVAEVAVCDNGNINVYMNDFNDYEDGEILEEHSDFVAYFVPVFDQLYGKRTSTYSGEVTSTQVLALLAALP